MRGMVLAVMLCACGTIEPVNQEPPCAPSPLPDGTALQPSTPLTVTMRLPPASSRAALLKRLRLARDLADAGFSLAASDRHFRVRGQACQFEKLLAVPLRYWQTCGAFGPAGQPRLPDGVEEVQGLAGVHPCPQEAR